MTFKAKLDDPESRAFWDAVERGARAYDELPDWQKGVLGGFENHAAKPEDAECTPSAGKAESGVE